MTLLLAIGMLGTVVSSVAAAEKVSLTYYFPVDAAGSLAKLMSAMVADFNKEHPNINVTPVYAGSYQDTQAKAVAASRAGNPPDVAVLLASATYQLEDLGVINPVDEFVADDKDKGYINDFFPALWLNAKDKGKIWAIPFQRSTPVLYYNVDAFKEAGLDPNRPPKTWDELASYAKKLTQKDAKGNAAQWGIEIPTYYWIFQGFVLEAGGQLMNDDGTRVYFDSQPAKQALQFWTDLQNKYGVMPKAALPWASVASDFMTGRTAMIFHSTGSLVGFRNGSKFKVGVAFMPAKQDFGVPTGGGNLYMFKNIPASHKEATWTFIKWMTSPEQAARWSMGSGYIVVRRSALDLPEFKEYTDKYPEALTAINQLKYANKEFATHELSRMWEVIGNALDAAMAGTKSVDAALKSAQQESEPILSQFR